MPVNDTTPPLIEHTELAVASIVSATVRPEVAVAVGEYVAPPTVAVVGAVDVKLIVWLPLLTVNDCWTWPGCAGSQPLPAWSASITQLGGGDE